jgi:hypothetical protein
MNDEDLARTWTALDPDAARRRRIDHRLSSWLEADDTSLAAEWLGFVRREPWPALGLVAASAIALLFATPLAWVARALL